VDTAKLFKIGPSQAVRLPEEYALPGDEVYIKWIGEIVMLMVKTDDPWRPFVESLDMFSDDFLGGPCDQDVFEPHGTVD